MTWTRVVLSTPPPRRGVNGKSEAIEDERRHHPNHLGQQRDGNAAELHEMGATAQEPDQPISSHEQRPIPERMQSSQHHAGKGKAHVEREADRKRKTHQNVGLPEIANASPPHPSV